MEGRINAFNCWDCWPKLCSPRHLAEREAMAETPAKQRKAAERDRMKARGFKRFEAWVHPDDAAKVRAYVDRLNKRRG